MGTDIFWLRSGSLLTVVVSCWKRRRRRRPSVSRLRCAWVRTSS